MGNIQPILAGGNFRVPLEVKPRRGRIGDYRKRDVGGRSIKDEKESLRDLATILALQRTIRPQSSVRRRRFAERYIQVFAHLALHRMGAQNFQPPAIRHIPFGFRADIDPNEVGLYFRYRAIADIEAQLYYFKIPQMCGPFANGGRMEGEKLFCALLRRMTATGSIFRVLIEPMGETSSTWSHALKWVYDHIYSTFGYKYNTYWGLQFFEPRFPE